MKRVCAIALTVVLGACASKGAQENKSVHAAVPPSPVPAAPAVTTAAAPHAAIGNFGIDLSARDLAVKPGE